MKTKYLICLALSTALFTNCKKGNTATTPTVTNPVSTTIVAPTVKTLEISRITTIGASGGGNTTANGGSSIIDRGLVFGLNPSPTINDTKIGTTSVTGSGDFTSELSGLKPSTKYYVRAFASNKVATGYGNEISFTTTSIGSATFNFSPMFIVGATLASCDIEVLGDGGDQVTERGLVWGLTENPTVNDNKVKHGNSGTGKYRLTIKNLTERTNYHVRAYAINAKGVSYSEDVGFKTIGKGKITYTFNKEANPNADQLAAYARLQLAVDSAVWYLSNYTSATKHIYLNYVEGVPTADANNEGWMRFGSNSGYHNIRTMLHEMNHTLGTGTTGWWTAAVVGGKFQGANTNALLNKIQKSTGVSLSGDTQHWWPYGLNQNSEVTSSWDYVYNCLLIEAMRKDGLPTSTSGAYIP